MFDALVWLTLQKKRGELTATESRTIEAFLLLDRWWALDLAVVMSVSAEEALSLDFLRAGPGHAQVDAVEVRDEAPQHEPRGFRVR